MEDLKQSLQKLSNDLQEIKSSLLSLTANQPLYIQNEWVDGQVVMLKLKISPRTLQNLRDKGTLPYSRIRGKFFYLVADIDSLLKNNYSKIPNSFK